MTNLCGYCGTYPGKACKDCQTFFDSLDDPPDKGHHMTYPKGHPPAANYGPVIFLPPAYDGFGAPIWDACEVCDGAPGGLCSDCRDDLADSEAERWADGRRDER